MFLLFCMCSACIWYTYGKEYIDYTHHSPMHNVTNVARIPISSPPTNDPPMTAISLATGVATFRLRQASTVADVSLTGHWVINLKGCCWSTIIGSVVVSSHTWSISINVLAVMLLELTTVPDSKIFPFMEQSVLTCSKCTEQSQIVLKRLLISS